MPHDVFISHSHSDKTVADAVCAKLEADGIRCWIAPRDIFPGESWPDAIDRAMQQCRVMVLVFSQKANASDQVKRELSLAADSGLTILPFRIEAIKPTGTFNYFLIDRHWLDALTPPMEAHIAGLSQTIRLLLAASSQTDTHGDTAETAAPNAIGSTKAPLPNTAPSGTGEANRDTNTRANTSTSNKAETTVSDSSPFVAGSSNAPRFEVDASGENGRFKTIGAALAAVRENGGDLIFVHPGEYRENLHVSSPLSPSRSPTQAKTPIKAVTILGHYAHLRGASDNGPVVYAYNTALTLVGLTIEQPPLQTADAKKAHAAVEIQGSIVEMVDCTVVSRQSAAAVRAAPWGENALMLRAKNSSFQCGASGSGVFILNPSGSTEATAELINCTIKGCFYGLNVGSKSTAKLTDCVVADNHFGVRAYGENARVQMSGGQLVGNEYARDAGSPSAVTFSDVAISEKRKP